MGMLDFLRKRSRRAPDQFWTSDGAREAGLLHAARSAPPSTIVLFHFPAGLRRFREVLDAANVPHRALSYPLSPSQIAGAAAAPLSVGLYTAEAPIPPDAWLAIPAPAATLNVIVAEHHVVPDPDHALLAFCAALPFPSTVRFHASLNDPGIAPFARQLEPLLARLGMSPHESLESSMISKSIERAQKAVRLKMRSSARAETAAEWLRLNCPDFTTEDMPGPG